MAEKECRKDGGYLVKITDSSEQNWVAKNVQDSNLSRTWIGASDAVTKDWGWAFDLSKVTESYWHPHQPDHGGNVEGCVELYPGYGYKWNDCKCSTSQSYVCESQQGVSCQPYSKL
ncbi:perlucin-like protein [Mytilus galloprovincialis]|uniref:perlucin-like protein n=1 Tax=Mytilus galloprovincialis TaxID=29158 RepID=UPI003F7BA549